MTTNACQTDSPKLYSHESVKSILVYYIFGPQSQEQWNPKESSEEFTQWGMGMNFLVPPIFGHLGPIDPTKIG